MTFTVIPTIVTGDVATAAWGNTYLKDNFDHILTAGGFLKHEVGGVEIDISGVAGGGILRGTGAGVWAILASFLDGSGRVTHEYGGIEADISAITTGGILRGTGAGTMGVLASFLDASGRVTHEYGGIEADISAVTTGGLLRGTGAGAMGVLTVGSNNDVLNVTSGNLAWEAARARVASNSSNQTTTSTSPVNITDLALSVEANTNYYFVARLLLSESGSEDARIELSEPSSTTISWGLTGSGQSVGTAGSSLLLTPDATERSYTIAGIVQVAGSSGTFQLQFYNAGAGSSTITLHGDSTLMMVKEV